MSGQRSKDITLIRGMKALGDCIYQRPYVRRVLGKVYLETPWPQLYTDMDVGCLKTESKLRRSNLNAREQTRWAQYPKELVNYSFRVHVSSRGPTFMGRSFGLIGSIPPDLPPFPPFPAYSLPVAVIRPVTRRREWRSGSRDPRWEYIAEAATLLKETHHVVLVGDLKNDQEVLVGDLPDCHTAFMHGELTFEDFMGLLLSADVLVSGVGSFIPIAVAAGKRALVIMGGHGYQNSVDCLVGSDWEHDITFLQPDPFCSCNGNHDCNKVIPQFSEQLADWRLSWYHDRPS